VPFFRRREAPVEPAPAGPPGREEVSRRLAAAAPALGARLAAELRPAVRLAIRREPDAAMDIGNSKFGGAPDLPRGTAWPMRDGPDGTRLPLQFFAQIDLGDAAAAAPAPLGLPAEGQLSFFADFAADRDRPGPGQPWHGDRVAVLYSPPRSLCVRCSPRLAPLPSGQLHPLGRWTWPSPVSDGMAGTDADRRALADVDAVYEAELRAAVPEGWSFTGRHQFGGHPRSAVDPAGSWCLLLELDSDEILEVDWGERGTVWWAVRDEDLAAGRWDAGRFGFAAR
jgi:hypothetical protein